MEQIELILLVGAIVAITAKRLRIPYTVGLVVAGILIDFVPIRFDINFSKPLIFGILLPPLIFEDAIYISWRWLRHDLPVILAFAILGVLLSALATAVLMYYLAGWTWEAAVIFGVLIAATDPVSVIATFREADVHGRLKLLVESESLFNDATAAVGFSIALAFAFGEQIYFPTAFLQVVLSIVGGVVCGLLIGFGVLFLAGRTDEDLVELSLTTIAAFGSFWLAEYFSCSGVLATLTAGLLLGNTLSWNYFSKKGTELSIGFWKFSAFAVNSIIFVTIGVNIGKRDFAQFIVPILVAIGAAIVGRAAAVYPVSALFFRSSLKVESRYQHVLVWGGLRGALGLALALGIPEEFSYRRQIILATFAVVAFSVFAQGLTMRPLLRKLKLVTEKSEKVKR
ncbi:MAG: sodium:proton antiporter [Pyrinomonadaceae bacterium]